MYTTVDITPSQDSVVALKRSCWGEGVGEEVQAEGGRVIVSIFISGQDLWIVVGPGEVRMDQFGKGGGTEVISSVKGEWVQEWAVRGE